MQGVHLSLQLAHELDGSGQTITHGSGGGFDFVIVDIVLIKVPRRHRNRIRIRNRISIRRWSNKLLVLKVAFFFSEKLLFQESVFESLSQEVGVDDL